MFCGCLQSMSTYRPADSIPCAHSPSFCGYSGLKSAFDTQENMLYDSPRYEMSEETQPCGDER